MNPSLRAKALPHTDTSRPAPDMLLATPSGGRPTKTERPQRLPKREPHPITIMSVRGIDGPVRANVDVTVELLDERTRSRVSICSSSSVMESES
jgi:hypothetical protein